jgi:hypothetical protein
MKETPHKKYSSQAWFIPSPCDELRKEWYRKWYPVPMETEGTETGEGSLSRLIVLMKHGESTKETHEREGALPEIGTVVTKH